MNSKAELLVHKIEESLKGPDTSAQILLRHLQAEGNEDLQLDKQFLAPLYDWLKVLDEAPGAMSLDVPPLPPSGAPTNEPVCAVIVETRPHPLLELVISQFSSRLNIPVQLYHGPDNENFIRASGLASLLSSGELQLTRLDKKELFPKSYNALFMNRGFWDSMIGRGKILVFQTDALLCPASPYSLEDFSSYDYIGSSWGPRRPIGLRIEAGGGGLSLRDWEYSTRCLERFAPQLWPGGEDGYFAFHLELMGGKVATSGDCDRFSSQQALRDRSFGVHQPRRMGRNDRLRLLQYCPEARRLF